MKHTRRPPLAAPTATEDAIQRARMSPQGDREGKRFLVDEVGFGWHKQEVSLDGPGVPEPTRTIPQVDEWVDAERAEHSRAMRDRKRREFVDSYRQYIDFFMSEVPEPPAPPYRHIEPGPIIHTDHTGIPRRRADKWANNQAMVCPTCGEAKPSDPFPATLHFQPCSSYRHGEPHHFAFDTRALRDEWLARRQA